MRYQIFIEVSFGWNHLSKVRFFSELFNISKNVSHFQCNPFIALFYFQLPNSISLTFPLYALLSSDPDSAVYVWICNLCASSPIYLCVLPIITHFVFWDVFLSESSIRFGLSSVCFIHHIGQLCSFVVFITFLLQISISMKSLSQSATFPFIPTFAISSNSLVAKCLILLYCLFAHFDLLLLILRVSLLRFQVS